MTNRQLTNLDFTPGLIICRAEWPVPDGSVLKAGTDYNERLFITSHKANGLHFRQMKLCKPQKNLFSPTGKLTQAATWPYA